MAHTSTGVAGLFSARQRAAGVAWAVVSVPATTAVAAFVDSRDAYLIVLIALASGAYTTPALVVGWRVARRVGPEERRAAALWLSSLVLMYVAGVGVLVGVVLGTGWANAAGAPFLVAIAVLIIAGNLRLVRDGSGERAVLVDVVDCLTWSLVVIAPAALLWADDVLTADEAWFAVPAALAGVGMLVGAFWMALLVTRRRGSGQPLGAFLLAFTALGTLDATLQATQAVSGFSLPAAPLVAVHACCAALVLLIPLHVPRRPTTGLGALAPHHQVRGGLGAALLPIAGIPTITLAALAEDHPATAAACVAALTTLALLVAARQALVQRETRHLYTRLEDAAARRRVLLAALVRNTDGDSHRVAAAFHRNAVAAYVAFVTFLQAADASPDTSRAVAVSGGVRAGLAAHVNALRDLVAATAPDPGGAPHPLAVVAAAHLDTLHEGTAPELTVTIADDLAIDWEVEATVVRITQLALDDIARRGGATAVEITLDAQGMTLVLAVTDDGNPPEPGDGTDPDARLAALRALVRPVGGRVDAPTVGPRGTTLTAYLDPALAAPNPGRPPHLQVIQNA